MRKTTIFVAFIILGLILPLVVATPGSTDSVVATTTTTLSGTAHWVTNEGIRKYSANANLDIVMDGTNVNVDGPVNIYSKGKQIASFNLHLVGTKTGNNMVFDDSISTATVLSTSTSEVKIGEILYTPGWDGQMTKGGRIRLDGDIYRHPENGYLDILLALSGTI